MEALFSLIPLILIFPLAGMLINLFFGRLLMPTKESSGPGIVASVAAGASFIVAVIIFIGLLNDPEGAEVPLFTWFNLASDSLLLAIPWRLKVDTLSVVMMLVVAGVGTLIHIYAISYMHGDINEQAHKRGYEGAEAEIFIRRRYARFFTFFNLFIFSMLILVSGNSYLVMFVGWELVGLCSYLLISFWNDDPEKGIANSRAGAKAFIANRIGDFGMLMAIFLIFWSFGTVKFDDVFARASCMMSESQEACLAEDATTYPLKREEEEHASAFGSVLARLSVSGINAEEGPFDTPLKVGPITLTLTVAATLITLFLLLGATGKSAQIPLFVWLPDAMAGPTPVSALIHAATMVTAGIYMITRSNVLYAMAPASANVVAIIGGLTAIVAATIAVAQFDIKKVLAYSTISQLGFMIAAVGLGGYIAGMFHLVTHAFFKALLFLSSGSVIHGMEHGHHHTSHGHAAHGFDPQDMRNMGGLRKHMPTTTWVYIVGSLALAGIFPLAGFWSKDEILLDASLNNTLVYVLLTVAAFFTAFYMGRQVLMVFFGSERTEAARHAHESDRVMTTPLVILAILSIIGGAMNLPFSGFHNLAHWLEESVLHAHAGDFNPVVALISTGLALLAIALSWLIYGRNPLKEGEKDPLTATGVVWTFLANRWYWDDLYEAVIIRPFEKFARFIALKWQGKTCIN